MQSFDQRVISKTAIYRKKGENNFNRIEQLFDPVLDGLFTFMSFKEILASKFEAKQVEDSSLKKKV